MKKEKVKFDLKKEAFRKMEQMHPHQLMLYISLIGSSIIFLFMIVAFTASRPPAFDFLKIDFPKSFVVSTIIMLISSYTASKIIPAYENDEIEALKNWLGVTFLLGLAFAAMQFLGWRELQKSNILFSGDRSGAYLYVISGLHVLHVGVVLIYLLRLLLKCHKVSLDLVQRLLYVTNPYQKVRFKILVDFWHFIDALWILLFFYLLFSF
ncbi:MAG: cytochrome C oxidase subunit III [Cytophagales bacterium CG12_big_fil_rev_8_21_14_0_65_40_12]|nr:MAG: cytochrome C oxidase subunit III [Cytophagales bacterium CG12_big_fil_rev_8_21_14_0_65_40_12]PIW04478.1 MAG: cytochrome C oxidase subunit III [Cytophagales bacterium CG17_big_fil_post_rev_8_21_14_2_50_40_13]